MGQGFDDYYLGQSTMKAYGGITVLWGHVSDTDMWGPYTDERPLLMRELCSYLPKGLKGVFKLP